MPKLKRVPFLTILAIGLILTLFPIKSGQARSYYSNGDLIRQKGKSTVYLISGGKKRPIL